MNLNRAAMATLACVVVLCAPTDAQQRTPSQGRSLQNIEEGSSARRASKQAELDAWLTRLVGRFHLTGQFRQVEWYVKCGARCPTLPQPVALVGVGDCVGIGAGPGVHCMINLADTRGQQGAAARVFPQTTLYGIDPQAPGISYLQVNSQSIAEGAVGELKGNTVMFDVKCPKIVDPPMETVSCSRKVRITAAPDSEFVDMWIQTDQRHRASGGMLLLEGPVIFELRLRRVHQGEALRSIGRRGSGRDGYFAPTASRSRFSSSQC